MDKKMSSEQNDKSRRVAGSFRDPAGFLFYRDDILYRQINYAYKEHYDHLIGSGLYRDLVDKGFLVSHQEAEPEASLDYTSAYKVIRPTLIPFISYPYEWCFSQLKNAALLTLRIQKTALEYGMSLKDCSAYNVQFTNYDPIHIDTLSFEIYREGRPWVAYRQFCQHFLAPLALMAYKDVRLSQLLRLYIDGIPLDLASALLPRSTFSRLSILLHIHLHAKSQKLFNKKDIDTARHRLPVTSLLRIIDGLEKCVSSMQLKQRESEWGQYYDECNYSGSSFEHKIQAVDRFLEKVRPGITWDLGANTGVFSRVASAKGIRAISFDVDPFAVERNYGQCRTDKDPFVLPLVMDLTNPSQGLGWQNGERLSLEQRPHPDCVMALALIHHLAISNNLPLGDVAKFLHNISNYLIIEFVPKSDPQVKKLLRTREDIFDGYSEAGFVQAFNNHFTIDECIKIRDTERTLYLMKRCV
jgi:hypothetical protein